MTAVREALRGQVLERLIECWHSGTTGALDVGEHYVQWSRHSSYVQVDCVCDALLDPDDPLGSVQRRLLAALGFELGESGCFARFDDEQALPNAAEIVVQVVEDVLDSRAAARRLPDPGNVCVVVPVGKCSAVALDDVVRPMVEACEVRRPTVVVSTASAGDRQMRLLDWLPLLTDQEPARLWHPFDEVLRAPQRIQWAAELATACDRLRGRGVHVFVVGPPFLPGETALYAGVVAELADSFVAVADHHGLRLCGRELLDLFDGPQAHRVLALYGDEDALVPGATGTIRFNEEDDVPYDRAMARVSGLTELDV